MHTLVAAATIGRNLPNIDFGPDRIESEMTKVMLVKVIVAGPSSRHRTVRTSAYEFVSELPRLARRVPISQGIIRI